MLFQASTFTYGDEKPLGDYITIASLEESGTAEVSSFAPALTTNKSSQSVHFNHAGFRLDAPPTVTLSIMVADSADELNQTHIRILHNWLLGRSEFQKLVIDGNSQFYYMCVFSNARLQYVGGVCRGIKVDATFDSWYAYGVPTKATKTVTSESTASEVIIQVDSDIMDDYIYPKVTIETTSATTVTIENVQDTDGAAFQITDLPANIKIVIDNELKTIVDATNGANYLANFNKKWLRLVRSSADTSAINTLKIKGKAKVTVECPNYALIGF